MDEQDKLNIDIMDIVQGMYAGDEEEQKRIYKDIIWHGPGNNPVSGDYHGFEEYTQLMPSRMAPLTQFDFTLHNVMVNGNYILTTTTLQGERKGKKIETIVHHLMRLTPEGKVAEGWSFVDELEALDEFFSA
jgi:ketosteroid isomerase-like protein